MIFVQQQLQDKNVFLTVFNPEPKNLKFIEYSGEKTLCTAGIIQYKSFKIVW